MKKGIKYYTKKVLACTLAMSMISPSIVKMATETVYAADPLACSQDHNWTGLHFAWTNIMDSNGIKLGWPRKLYFYDGDEGACRIRQALFYVFHDHSSFHFI